MFGWNDASGCGRRPRRSADSDGRGARRSRRVAEVREEPARKLTIDVGRHLGGVAVTAEVKWVNHNMAAGREISKRPVTQVESCEKCHPVVINALFRHYSTTSPPPKTKGLFRA